MSIYIKFLASFLSPKSLHIFRNGHIDLYFVSTISIIYSNMVLLGLAYVNERKTYFTYTYREIVLKFGNGQKFNWNISLSLGKWSLAEHITFFDILVPPIWKISLHFNDQCLAYISEMDLELCIKYLHCRSGQLFFFAGTGCAHHPAEHWWMVHLWLPAMKIWIICSINYTTIEMLSYQYRNSTGGDKTVYACLISTVAFPYTGKKTPLGLRASAVMILQCFSRTPNPPAAGRISRVTGHEKLGYIKSINKINSLKVCWPTFDSIIMLGFFPQMATHKWLRSFREGCSLQNHCLHPQHIISDFRLNLHILTNRQLCIGMGDPALCLGKCMCRSLRLWNSLGIQVNALTSLSFLFLFFRPAVGGFLSCGTSTGACTSAGCSSGISGSSAGCSSGISGSVSSSSASATTACHGRVRLFPPKLTTTWYLNRSTCTSVADCSSPS